MKVSHLEARLDWLIRMSGIEQSSPLRRLNAIENQLMYLAQQWRAIEPIDPIRELRMSKTTRDLLLAWVFEKSSPAACIQARTAVYTSVSPVNQNYFGGMDSYFQIWYGLASDESVRLTKYPVLDI